MKLPSVDSVETLSLGAMRRLVAGLVGKMHKLEADVGALRAENQSLRDDNERLKLENDSLRRDNQMLRDEIARLKNLPPRPPFRPSGMEKASEPATGKNNASKRGRSAKRDRDQVTREVVIKANAPEGSRLHELVLSAEVVRYRRERWVTPDGKTVVARLPDGIAGGIGPGLRQLAELNRDGIATPLDIIKHIAPLGWQHISLTGDYIWTPTDTLDQTAQAKRFNARGVISICLKCGTDSPLSCRGAQTFRCQ